MKRLLTLISVLLLGVAAAGANMITNTYSSQSAFLSAVSPVYYLQTFSNSTAGTSISYSGNGYSYTIGADGPLQTLYGWLQETVPADGITISFTGGGVTAVGANFFAVNTLAQPRGTTITLNFAGGPTRTITSTTSTSTFTGYTFDTPLTSMTISAQSSFPNYRWAALDNLVVGSVPQPPVETPTPEPGTWMLLSAGIGLLGFAKFRRR